MNIYYTSVDTLKIYDEIQVDSHELTSEIVKCAFQYLDTTLILLNPFKKRKIGLKSKTGSIQTSFFKIQLKKTTSRILVNRRSNEGILLILKDINSFVHQMSDRTFIDEVSTRNTITLIDEPCTDSVLIKINELFKHLWLNHGILHHILILTQCQFLIFFDLLSIDPDTNIWGVTSLIDLQNISSISDLFTYYYFDLNGYPIRISIFERFPTCVTSHSIADLLLPPHLSKVGKILKLNGIDPIILFNSFSHLNFTPNIETQYEYYGHRTPNGSYVGSLGKVINNETDISFNGRYVKGYETDMLIEFLKPTSFDKICFLTPKARKISRWNASLFKSRSLIALLLLIFVISCIWLSFKVIITRQKWDLTPVEPIYFIIIEFCMMLLSAVSAKMPKFSVERQFVAGILLGAWYFSGIFQAALSTSMSTVTYEKDIDTFKQLLASDLPIFSSSRSLQDFLGENQTTSIEALKARYYVQEFNTSLNYMTAHYRNVTCIERYSDARIIIKSKFTDSNGLPLIHIMKNCLRFYYISYIVRKNYPFTEDFDRIFGYFTEAGLINHWYHGMMHAMSHYKGEKEVLIVIPEPCNLNNLRFSFYLLLIGYTVSGFILILELIFARRAKKN
uniref:CSON011075 protein n=1 Tax=Culicoides sonorensis TaxID=179676 RepID=A0A336LMD1_CULSO